MDNGSGYEAGSEHSLPSTDISLSDYQNNKPCEICGSDVNEHLLMTCSTCRDTREHTYCGKELLDFVPAVWTCEEYNSAPLVNQANVDGDSIETANSRIDQVEEVVGNEDSIDQTATSSRASNHVENQITTSGSCNEISATHQPSQVHTSPVLVEEASSPVSMDTSPIEDQKQSDSEMDNEVVVHQNTTSDDSCNEISATDQPSQGHTSPSAEEASFPVSMDASPIEEQNQSDSDMLSDSESTE